MTIFNNIFNRDPAAVEELRRRPDEFRVFVDGSWEYFLAALATDAWGDELTLQAVADGVKIKVKAPHAIGATVSRELHLLDGVSYLTHWLISTQVADAFSVVVHVVTSTDENWHLVYAPRALTARACFLSYVHPVHYNVVTDEARGADDPQSPVL